MAIVFFGPDKYQDQEATTPRTKTKQKAHLPLLANFHGRVSNTAQPSSGHRHKLSTTVAERNCPRKSNKRSNQMHKTITYWPKEAGPKPTERNFRQASILARPDTADHVVVAMSLRPTGVTQQEVRALFNRPHRNKLRKLVEDNKAKEVLLPTKSRLRRVRLLVVK